MDTPLAIFRFFFFLIAFIRLDRWYGDVREFSGSYAGENETKKATPDFCRATRVKLTGLRNSAPQGSIIVVGCIISALTVLSLYVPFDQPKVDPQLVLWVPTYWIGGVVLLHKGRKMLAEIDREIKKVIG